MNRRNNARWRENERRMEDELLLLLREKDADRITVKEVCERAGVNRSTFYAHFTDVRDALGKTESRLHAELLGSYGEPGSPERAMLSDDSFLVFLRHVRERRPFYLSVLRTRRDFPLEQGFDQLMDEVVRPRCAEAGIVDEAEVLYYFVAFQASFTMVLRRWVEGGCEEGEEAIARVLRNCVPAVWESSAR